jgi:hypothetical protein
MRTIRGVLVLLTLAIPMSAVAQPIDHAAEPFRKWDLGGGLGIRFGETTDTVVPWGSWNAEFGRYWTSHIKTTVGVTTAGQSNYVGPYVPYGFQKTDTRPAAYSATIAYQFFDNVFVHPYLVGGARFASYTTATTTYLPKAPYTETTVTGPAAFDTRPTIGGGFKSYFGNGRAFMRTELLMAVNPHGGAPHVVLTFGAGVDF